MDEQKITAPDARKSTVLVVEDEWIIAMDLEAILIEAGYTVIGPARRVPEALALISNEDIDVAILDMNLAGQSSEPIATRLRQEGTQFVFLSGNSAKHLAPDLASATLLSKPVCEKVLLSQLEKMLGSDEAAPEQSPETAQP